MFLNYANWFWVEGDKNVENRKSQICNAAAQNALADICGYVLIILFILRKYLSIVCFGKTSSTQNITIAIRNIAIPFYLRKRRH